jgi:hypothetical protein
MTAPRRARRKKYFTPSEANATLPLLRSILRDVTALAAELKERQERLGRVAAPARGQKPSDAYQEELQEIQAEFERDRGRMQEYFEEIQRLGVELKDPYTGLVDFPSILDDHEVYLCWRLGEPAVAHWHELDAGFAGRRKLATADATKR